MTPEEISVVVAAIKEATRPPLIDTSHAILAAFVAFVGFFIRYIAMSFRSHVDSQIQTNKDLYTKHNEVRADLDFLQGQHDAFTGSEIACIPDRRKKKRL
jgi:hypothetical protein